MHTFKMLFNVSFCILQQQFDQYILHIKTSRQLFVPACCDITRQKPSSPPEFSFSVCLHPPILVFIYPSIKWATQARNSSEQSNQLCASVLFSLKAHTNHCAQSVYVCVRA